MTEIPPPVAIAVSFVDRINRRELDGLAGLMSDDHRLEIFDEDPVIGKSANVVAWRDYFDRFPTYVIHPLRISEQGASVAILGHTTGSHLGLGDDEERKLTLIWIAVTTGGVVTRWRLIIDNLSNRVTWGLQDI